MDKYLRRAWDFCAHEHGFEESAKCPACVPLAKALAECAADAIEAWAKRAREIADIEQRGTMADQERQIGRRAALDFFAGLMEMEAAALRSAGQGEGK